MVVRCRDRLGNRHVGVGQGRHDVVLAEDVVGPLGMLASRGSAEDEFAIAPVDEQCLVRVSLGMVSDSEGIGRTEGSVEIGTKRVLVVQPIEVVELGYGLSDAPTPVAGKTPPPASQPVQQIGVEVGFPIRQRPDSVARRLEHRREVRVVCLTRCIEDLADRCPVRSNGCHPRRRVGGQ